MSLAAILVGGFAIVRNSAKTIADTLTAKSDWPVYDNLSRRQCPPRFVGRDTLLKDLKALLHRGAGTVVQATVQGSGGFGKTTLAIETAWQMKDRFRGVWLLRAENASSLQNSFTELARAWGIETTGQRPDDVAKETLRQVVADPEPWLLIYDNADTPSVLNDLMPGDSGDHKTRVLITSRSKDWPPARTMIKVGVLDPEAATDLLASYLPERDRGDLARLADHLGYWPLGLVGAAGYLRCHKNTSVEAYIESFDITKSKLATADYAQGRNEEDLTYIAVLGVTTDQLSQDDRDLLSVLAFLNPDDLWPEMIAEGAVGELRDPFQDEPMPEFLKRAGEEPSLIIEGFDRLAENSVIEQEEHRWTMHRMTGEIWRGVLAAEGSSAL